MYANYDLLSKEIDTFTDFDAFLAQLPVENALDKEMFAEDRHREYMRFIDLPQALQDKWKPALHDIFSLPQVFHCPDIKGKALGICSFALHENGTCNFKDDDSLEVYNRVFCQYVYGNRTQNKEAVLVVHGVTLRNNDTGLKQKRERAQVIDAIMLDL